MERSTAEALQLLGQFPLSSRRWPRFGCGGHREFQKLLQVDEFLLHRELLSLGAVSAAIHRWVPEYPGAAQCWLGGLRQGSAGLRIGPVGGPCTPTKCRGRMREHIAEDKKGAETRRRIIEAAKDLFHRQGMNATSLGEILRSANAGKGQFYQHFASREDLVVEVLRERRRVVESAAARPFEQWSDVVKWMESFLERQVRFGFERGCPDGTAAYSVQSNQVRQRQELNAIFRCMCGRLADFLAREQAAGRLKPEADVVRLAGFTVACIQGGLLLGLLDKQPAAVRSAFDEAQSHLRSFIVEPVSGSPGSLGS